MYIIEENLSDELMYYSREQLLSGGYFCGTIDGFKYHILMLEEQCSYCQLFIDRYERKNIKENKDTKSILQWRIENPELAKLFTVPRYATSKEIKKRLEKLGVCVLIRKKKKKLVEELIRIIMIKIRK